MGVEPTFSTFNLVGERNRLDYVVKWVFPSCNQSHHYNVIYIAKFTHSALTVLFMRCCIAVRRLLFILSHLESKMWNKW